MVSQSEPKFQSERENNALEYDILDAVVFPNYEVLKDTPNRKSFFPASRLLSASSWSKLSDTPVSPSSRCFMDYE